MLQGTKYSCGKQILWDVFAHANFYTEVKNFVENMGWMGLANLSEKCYSPLLLNMKIPLDLILMCCIHILMDNNELLLSLI